MTQPRPNSVFGNLSLVPRTMQVATPAADGGERIVARADTSYAPAAAAPMTAHAVAPQARPAGFGMVTTPKVAQPTMSAPQQQQPMIHPTMGATALQAQPARQPILKDEMAALDRLVSRQPERVERTIDDRPFIAPPASEPAMRAQPQVAEPVVPQSRMQQPARADDGTADDGSGAVAADAVAARAGRAAAGPDHRPAACRAAPARAEPVREGDQPPDRSADPEGAARPAGPAPAGRAAEGGSR